MTLSMEGVIFHFSTTICKVHLTIIPEVLRLRDDLCNYTLIIQDN